MSVRVNVPAANVPASVREMSVQVNVRAANVPASVREMSVQVNVRAANVPASVREMSVRVNVRAANVPASVREMSVQVNVRVVNGRIASPIGKDRKKGRSTASLRRETSTLRVVPVVPVPHRAKTCMVNGDNRRAPGSDWSLNK